MERVGITWNLEMTSLASPTPTPVSLRLRYEWRQANEAHAYNKLRESARVDTDSHTWVLRITCDLLGIT